MCVCACVCVCVCVCARTRPVVAGYDMAHLKAGIWHDWGYCKTVSSPNSRNTQAKSAHMYVLVCVCVCV